MADSKLFDSLMFREMGAMSIYLSTKAEKTSLTLEEYIQTRLLSGTSPENLEAELTDDLLNGGRIFGEFRNAIKATAKGSINRVRDAGYFSNIGIDVKFRWCAIFVNTCPNCIDRHNQVKSWEEWEVDGLPRTGATVCRENCHCVLIPEKFSEIEPIKRG